MKNITFLFLLMAGLVFGQNKKVISSDIRWQAYKVLKSDSFNHYGTIKLKSGDITVANNSLVGGNFILDLNQITADDLKDDPKLKLMLENHLRSDDFFDVEKYPTAFFKITSVKPISGAYNSKVTGNLTLHNHTKTISFPVNIKISGDRVDFTSAQFNIYRKDFGLNYNVFEEMLISKNVEMNIRFTAK